MLAYGADLFRVRGFGLDPDVTGKTFETLESLGSLSNRALQISAYRYSPLGMSGVQTISYELAEQLKTIHHVFVPAGGGGLALAIARGFSDLVSAGQLERSPCIHCVQPIGNDTIAGPLRQGSAKATSVTCTTRISGLQVPNVVDGDTVIAECEQSGGTGHTIEDIEATAVQKQLAREEGVFCEPAAAVALAGALQAAHNGEIDLDETVVCMVTGSGFKDLASAESMAGDRDCPLVSVSHLPQIIRGVAPST
jgi:threonine synthase